MVGRECALTQAGRGCNVPLPPSAIEPDLHRRPLE